MTKDFEQSKEILDSIKIIYGDCLAVMEDMPDESIDLIVTNPPYLINYKSCWGLGGSNNKPILGDNDYALIEKSINEMYRVLKMNSAAYVFCSFKKVDYFIRYCQNAGFVIKNNIIWVKNNWSAGDLKAAYGGQYEIILLLNKGRKYINGSRLSDVWFFDRVPFQSQHHQNEKPVNLLEQCIIKHSGKGDVVLDPFMGSGSTGIACMHTGRKFVGIEKDADYYEIAGKRLEKEYGFLPEQSV